MTHIERKLKPHTTYSWDVKNTLDCLLTGSWRMIFFCWFFFSFFPSCKTQFSTSHSSSHTFNSINDTHWKQIVTPTTYSWDVENTLDLIDSKYFLNCLNTFDEYITKAMSIDVSRIVNESSKFHVKNKVFLNNPKDYIFLHKIII